jgi:hypothetical protein
MQRTGIATLVLSLGGAAAMSAEPATVLYRDDAVKVERTLPDPTDLWVEAADLPKVNGFVLKPEGACLDDLCVPIKQDKDSDLFVKRDADRFISVTKLADRLGQSYAVDRDKQVWSFAEVPATRRSFFEQGIAPDFTLPDVQGRPVKLSDLRGRKVLLLTWASW